MKKQGGYTERLRRIQLKSMQKKINALKMHMSLDNYVNMEEGGKDFKWDHEVIEFCVTNLEDVDTILLGRKTAEELIPFWDEVATNPNHDDFALGRRI